MNRRAAVRRVVLIAPSLLGIVCLAGCFGGYLYPAVEVTPMLKLDLKGNQFHAIRIDAWDSLDDFKDSRACYVMNPVSVSALGIVPGQMKVSLEAGWGQCMLLPTMIQNHRWHELRVRLYRPGYQPIEIAPGMGGRDIEWSKAVGRPAQMKAVDALLARWSFGYHGESQTPAGQFDHLASGSVCSGQRGCLEYAASEYQRIADEESPTGDELGDDGMACKEKAKKLRALANQ